MSISRRGFIRNAAIGAAGVAGAAVVGAGCSTALSEVEKATATTEAATSVSRDWLGAAPVIEDSEIAEDINADVVVIGAGISGCCATRAVVEEGGSVIVIEKAESAQGRGSELAVINGPHQEALGRIVDAQKVVSELWKECNCRTDRAILLRWANQSAAAFDWLLEATPNEYYMADSYRADIPDEYKDRFILPKQWPGTGNYDYNEEFYPVFPVSFQFHSGGSVGFAPFPGYVLDYAASQGDVQSHFGAFAKVLVKDDDGRVTGVIFQDSEDKYIRATATRGVILATGDYGGNQAMLEHFCPAAVDVPVRYMNVDVNGDFTNTGDGHKMAVWAGAELQTNHAPMIHNMGANTGIGTLGIAPYLLLNSNGTRFCNEDIPGQQLENQLEAQPHQYAYQFFDGNWTEQLRYMPEGHGIPSYVDDSKPQNNDAQDRYYKARDEIERSVAEGLALKGETIDELLAQIDDIDIEQAKVSIERYNELAGNGEDEDFGKVSKRLFPIETGPFYACRNEIGPMLVCIGGVKSDTDFRAYDRDWNIIPGLYLGGNMQGGHFANEYPICVPGISHSMAVVLGRDVGAAAYQGL